MQQMQSRRRQSTEYFSPANSTNQKQQKPFHNRHHPAFSLTTQSQEEDDIDYLVGNQSSHLLMMDTNIGAAEHHLGFSFGSCATWNTASLLNKCPTTPSPVLSSSLPSHLLLSLPDDEDDPSFATPIQSSCIVSNGAGRESSSPEGTQQESRKVASIRGDDSSKKRCSTGTTPRHFLCEDAEDYFETSSRGIDDDDGRLPTVKEEKGCNHNRHVTMSSLYLDAESSDEDSDMESFIEERTASAMKVNFVDETRRVDTLAGTLIAWRESRTIKLMDKLRRRRL